MSADFNFQHLFAPFGRRYRKLFLCLVLGPCCLVIGILAPQQVHGQATGVNCFVSSSGFLDFGAINLFAGNTDNSLTVNYTCQATAAPAGIAYIKMCIDLDSGTGGSSIAPRLMSAIDGSGLTLHYNFFADAARSLIIGDEGAGGYQPLSVTLQVPVSSYFSSVSGSAVVYARIPSGQTSLISSPYTYYLSSFPGTTSMLRYAWSPSVTPASCTAGSGGVGAPASLNFQVQAHIQSGCFVSATDLNFGTSTGQFTANTDQASTLSVACTSNSPWQVGLDHGQHSPDGVTRYMIGPAGKLIQYGLYQNAARTHAWGNTQNSDTVIGSGGTSIPLSVYGRVPVQTAAPSGSYSDVVTVTLTY